jgi:hypothetical protein
MFSDVEHELDVVGSVRDLHVRPAQLRARPAASPDLAESELLVERPGLHERAHEDADVEQAAGE